MKKTALTLLATVALTAGASAQLLTAFDVSGFGNTGNTVSPTPVVGGGVTATGLTRTTVVASAANNSFSSNTWNITSTLNTATNYIAFDVTVPAGATAPVTFSTLQFAINGSNTAPNTGTWAYTLDGGTTFTLGTTANGGAFTTLNAQPTAQALFDFADFTLAAGATTAAPTTAAATVEFRFYEYGANSINGGAAATTGTTRIANITGAGNPQYDLVLGGPNAFVQPVNAPEPSTLAVMAGAAALVGLVIYRRSRIA